MSKKKYKRNSAGIKSRQKSLENKSEMILYKFSLMKFKYLIFLPVLFAIITSIYFIYSAFNANGYFGFPLDDPWIHLTFAKNLINYGSFSYYKNELITSGSTSPVYTLLLSLFFIFSKNEFIISYLIGIIFGAALVFMMTKISITNLKNSQLLVVLAAMLIALEPKLNLINVSGMETSMFIFLIAASFYAYQNKKIVLLGIFMGLTIWCRPDGFVLWIAIALDFFYRKFYLRNNIKAKSENELMNKEILTAFSIAIIFTAGYFIFNYILSGSVLPNTYKAKLEYYQKNNRAFFLENDVLKYFTDGEFIVIWIPFLIYILVILKSFFRRERNSYLVYLLFIIGLITVYYIKLPFAHRFGRYLMPVIPFYILIAVAGIEVAIKFIHSKIFKEKSFIPNVIFILYGLTAIVIFIYQNTNSIADYSALCKYHNDRHVAAGKWINKNTSETDIIATHDIGAITFYGERKIIDMAGLITPELADHLNDKTYSEYINAYLANHKVNYLVTLRNWFEVVNDKPVYMPVNEFEFLEIYKYDPTRTHIQPREVSQINQAAIQLLQQGSVQQAVSYLQQSLILDSNSSKTNLLLGAAYESAKDFKNAEKYFNNALRFYPDYAEAYFGLAKVKLSENNPSEASTLINKCLELNPDFSPALQLRSQLNGLIEK